MTRVLRQDVLHAGGVLEPGVLGSITARSVHAKFVGKVAGGAAYPLQSKSLNPNPCYGDRTLAITGRPACGRRA